MSNFSEKHSTNLKSNLYEANHDIVLRGRKILDLTGVKAVESFDSEEFLLETVQGYVDIKGRNLQIKNLDVEQGMITISGRIDQFSYIEANGSNDEKNKGFFQKIFK